MAKKELVESIVKLYSKLGGNMNDVLGSRSNITFLGTGKNPEPFVDMSINMEAVGALGKSKVLEELKSPMGYLTADKLNDIQAGKLYENMLKLDNFYNPKAPPANIIDMGTGTRNLDQKGLSSLRSKVDVPEGVDPRDTILPSSMMNVEDVVTMQGKGGMDFIDFVKRTDPEGAAKLQKEVDRLNAASDAADARLAIANMPDAPSKRASAREFLVEALKADDTFSTKLTSIIDAEDVKYITEGGGGIMGDPLILVEKYFGPRILEMIPTGATGEDIITFTRRVMDNVEDAAGLKPDNPRFDRFTAKFIDEMAQGGRAGFMAGGIGKFTKAQVLIERLKNTIKDSKNKTDELSVYVNETFPGFIKEIKANPKLAENEKVWKTLGLDLPSDQRLVVHSDDTVDFFRQTKFGPHNIELVEKFMAKHPFLSREDALRILKMEPEDRVLEITRLKVLNNRTKNAGGGLAKILEV